MASKRKIIVVLGPTAGGKSGVALALAKKLGGFLISADSRQVFKHMDIGTNKDKGDWRDGIFYLTGALRPFDKLRAGEAQRDKCYIREYMIDVVEPDEPFSVGDWVESVKKILKKEKDQAIVVGGTGLYVSALTEGYELPGKFDAKLRARLEKQVAKYGWPYLIIDVLTEFEAAGMSGEERKSLGLKEELEFDLLIKKAYGVLGLITFFTTGPDETRAWTLKKGQKIPGFEIK